MDPQKNFKIDLELPFANEKIAHIVYDVLRVDSEPKRSGVTKNLTLQSNVVNVELVASLARQLRVAVNNYFEKVDLIIETIQAMGPPKSEKNIRKMPEHTPAPTPSRAVYGFVMFLSFKVFFVIYLIWAIVPEKYFRAIGIDFLPQRYWAISVPIYLLTVLTVFAFIIYPSLGLLMTPNVDDMRTVRDEVGIKINKNEERFETSKDGKCACKNWEGCWKEYYELGEDSGAKRRIPAVKDLNVWDVSEHLYL